MSLTECLEVEILLVLLLPRLLVGEEVQVLQVVMILMAEVMALLVVDLVDLVDMVEDDPQVAPLVEVPLVEVPLVEVILEVFPLQVRLVQGKDLDEVVEDREVLATLVEETLGRQIRKISVEMVPWERLFSF